MYCKDVKLETDNVYWKHISESIRIFKVAEVTDAAQTPI